MKKSANEHLIQSIVAKAQSLLDLYGKSADISRGPPARQLELAGFRLISGDHGRDGTSLRVDRMRTGSRPEICLSCQIFPDGEYHVSRVSRDPWEIDFLEARRVS